MPCSDIARMSDGSRLLPSASRFRPIARPISRFSVSFMAHRLSTPPAAQTGTAETPWSAAAARGGTRSRASSDSTSPTPTVTARTAAASAPAPRADEVPIGSTACAQQHGEQQQLERRAVQNRGQRRAAVVEHHGFVNHRQFQVRVRIVERHAAIFRQQHGNKPAASSAAPRPPRARACVSSETLPVCTLSDSTAVDDGRFREHGITDFARRAHALEGRAGFHRGPGSAKPRQRQQVNQQQHVAVKTQRRRRPGRAAAAAPRRPAPPTPPPGRR